MKQKLVVEKDILPQNDHITFDIFKNIFNKSICLKYMFL